MSSLPPDQIPPYEDWLADSGREDNPSTRDDYARQYFSADLPPAVIEPAFGSPAEGPLDESPTDGPVIQDSEPQSPGELADDATAEALALADQVLADLDQRLTEVITAETTPAMTVAATVAGNVAQAVTEATDAAGEVLAGLDVTLAGELAEQTIQATDLADQVLPPNADPVTTAEQQLTFLNATWFDGWLVRQGVSRADWDAGNVSCDTLYAAWMAWSIVAEPYIETIGPWHEFDTPFGLSELDNAGTKIGPGTEPGDYAGLKFPVANLPPGHDPPADGWWKINFGGPDWALTQGCVLSASGGESRMPPETLGCKSLIEYLADRGYVANQLPADILSVEVEHYLQYRGTCGQGRGGLGGSCDQPMYVTLCTSEATPGASAPTSPGTAPATPGTPPAGTPAEELVECAQAIRFPAQTFAWTDEPKLLSEVIGLTDNLGVPVSVPGLSGAFAPVRYGVTLFQFAVSTVVNWGGLVARSIEGASLCRSALYLRAQSSRLAISLLGMIFPGSFDKTDRAYQQAMDAECPQEFPSPAEATVAWLAGECTTEEWTCWTQIGNVRPAEAAQVRDASRDRPGTLQVIDLWRRGQIDRDTLDQRLRSLGVTRQSERDEMVALSYYVPTVSDLIPWMVKDVFNPQVVQDFGLDDQFTQSYSQQAKDWARANGISDEIMQAAWRAHWHLPSPTQLATFWHLFRHDGRHGTPDQFRQRIRDALRQADWLPTWIDDYIDSQYRPLTRVDARRAYELGALSERELFLAYTHAGYSDANAQVLVDFNKLQLTRKFAGHWAAKEYQRGTLSHDEAAGWLARDGADLAAVTYALDTAAGKRDADRRRRCIAAARKRFLAGEIDETELAAQLQQLIGDGQVVADLVAAAKCDRHNRSKLPAVSQICGWLTNGAINAADAFARLQRLGYDDEDAALLLRDCQLRIGLSISKAQARQIAEAAKRRQQLERERLKALKETRENNIRMARLRDAKARTSQRRSSEIVRSASQLALHLHLSVEDTFPVINQYYRAALRNTIQLPDDILLALANVAARDTAKDLADYVAQVDAALAGLPAFAAAPEAPDAAVVSAEPWPPPGP